MMAFHWLVEGHTDFKSVNILSTRKAEQAKIHRMSNSLQRYSLSCLTKLQISSSRRFLTPVPEGSNDSSLYLHDDGLQRLAQQNEGY